MGGLPFTREPSVLVKQTRPGATPVRSGSGHNMSPLQPLAVLLTVAAWRMTDLDGSQWLSGELTAQLLLFSHPPPWWLSGAGSDPPRLPSASTCATGYVSPTSGKDLGVRHQLET